MNDLEIAQTNNFTNVLRKATFNNPVLSILISSYKRLNLLKRTLWSIQHKIPTIPYEVIISEEISNETPKLLEELKKFTFPTTVVLSNKQIFEETSGMKHYYNNAVQTYNAGLLHCNGQILGVLGNEVILTDGCVQQVLDETTDLNTEDYIIYTTTYNLPEATFTDIGEYGENLKNSHIKLASRNVLQSPTYKTIVNNYFSICPLSSMIKINGWDYKYFESIAAEDSDVSRRLAAIPGSKVKFSTAISLHQAHNSAQFNSSEKAFWDAGVAKAREHYHSWNGNYRLEQNLELCNSAIINILKMNY